MANLKRPGPRVALRGSTLEALEARRLLAAHYVLHISVDGLRPDAVTTLGPADAPNFYRLRTQGAFTDNARTDFDVTLTLPNHSGMVTGRRTFGPTGHYYASNVDPAPGETLHSIRGSYVASTWDVAHDNGLRTGLFSGKTKFSLFDTSYDADAAPLQGGAPDVTGVDNGRDKIDVTVIEADHAVMTDALIANMTGPKPLDYAFVHYAYPDTFGHAVGWMMPAYLDSVKSVDAQIGRVLDMVNNTPALAGHTTVIVNADHGGETGYGSHGNPLDRETFTIPFYIWGEGVTAGADLYTINPANRQDPGVGRIDYDAPLQPIRNADGANLAMSLLGLPDVPGSTTRIFGGRDAWKPDLTASSDLGQDADDDLTPDDTPTFTGVAPAGSALQLVSDGEVVGSGVATAAGTYSLTASSLPDGTHRITVAVVGGAPITRQSYPLTVTVDRTGPKVTQVQFNGQAASANPRRISVAFSEFARVTLGDLLVRNDATGAIVPASKMAMSYDGATNVATWSFPGLPNGVLAASGNYTATLRATTTVDLAGNALDGDGNGVGGDAKVIPFFRLAGDANADRTVDRTDFFMLYTAPSQAADDLAADFDGDGRVGFADYQIFELNFGKSVPAPVPAAPIPAATMPETLAIAKSVKAKPVPELPKRPVPAKAPPPARKPALAARVIR